MVVIPTLFQSTFLKISIQGMLWVFFSSFFSMRSDYQLSKKAMRLHILLHMVNLSEKAFFRQNDLKNEDYV